MRLSLPRTAPPVPVVVTGLLVAGAIACSWIWTRALLRARSHDEVIRVVGSARRAIRSDYILWNGSVEKTAPTVALAYADVKAKLAIVRAYLVSKGVPGKDILPRSVSVETLYTRPRTTTSPTGVVTTEASSPTQVAGYKITQSLEVRSSQVEQVEAATRDASDLLAKGVVLSAQTPSYLYTKTSELKVAMQAEAARDALNRAQAIAQNAGCRLGDVRFARMMTPSITPYYSKDEDDGGVDDTTALDKKITAIVVAGYGVR